MRLIPFFAAEVDHSRFAYNTSCGIVRDSDEVVILG
jgi:hypothetical protein